MTSQATTKPGTATASEPVVTASADTRASSRLIHTSPSAWIAMPATTASVPRLAEPSPGHGWPKISHSPASAMARPAKRRAVSVCSLNQTAANTPVTSGVSPKITEISPEGMCRAPQ